jgi:hypothetical protein
VAQPSVFSGTLVLPNGQRFAAGCVRPASASAGGDWYAGVMRGILQRLFVSLLALALVASGMAHAHYQPCPAAAEDHGARAAPGVARAQPSDHSAIEPMHAAHSSAHDPAHSAGHMHADGHAHPSEHAGAADHAHPAEPTHDQQATHRPADCLCLNCCGISVAFAVPDAPVAAMVRTASTLQPLFGHREISDRSVPVDPGIPKPLA